MVYHRWRADRSVSVPMTLVTRNPGFKGHCRIYRKNGAS